MTRRHAGLGTDRCVCGHMRVFHSSEYGCDSCFREVNDGKRAAGCARFRLVKTAVAPQQASERPCSECGEPTARAIGICGICKERLINEEDGG